MSAVAWRSTMSYLRYSQLCGEVVRECCKEPYYSKAGAHAYIRYVVEPSDVESQSNTSQIRLVALLIAMTVPCRHVHVRPCTTRQ